jgi:hypothetical protein
MENVLAKGSYEKINYNLRPAKSIERKMLCEAIGRLAFLGNIKKIRYIGFGSTYFTDFNLIHKQFGITDLISIEEDKHNKERFEFNSPFSCIKLYFERSNVFFSKHKWDKSAIIWLDYDGRINSDVLFDIKSFFNNAKPGSLFLMSLNVKPDNFNKNNSFNCKTEREYRYKTLIDRVGDTKVPIDTNIINLGYKENPRIIYQIINDEIQQQIKERNAVHHETEKILYDQLFHFLYDDGTLMLTVGGIIYKKSQLEIVRNMRFSDLEFIRKRDRAFFIKVPLLTYKEIQYLNSHLPGIIEKDTGMINKSFSSKMNIKIPIEDIKNFAKIYRFFPNYTEAIF